MSTTQNKCRTCNKSIIGRTDKKFCSVYCKNQFHINQRSVTKNVAVRIDSYLKRNYAILLEILGDKKKLATTKHQLDKLKYRFKYHTHTELKSKKDFKMVYDIGLHLSKNSVLIEKFIP